MTWIKNTHVKAKKRQQTSEGSRIFNELFGKSVKSSIPNYNLKQYLQTWNITIIFVCGFIFYFR